MVLPVRAVRDAADKRLLAAAVRLRRYGTSMFIVVSGDHAFAPLARQATVVVLTLDPQFVSQALARDALAVLPVDPELAQAAMR